MIDSEIIKERLQEIDENLKLLSELRKMPFREFKTDLKASKSAERCLEINIQCILDICHHIISANNWPRPQNNKESIETIANYNVIPRQFANRISPMVGLRNILIHEYLKVNVRRVYEHLQNIEDFRKFQKYILKYIEQA